MKKLLLSTAAVALAVSAMPAHAGVDLELGGFFRGYAAGVDQDEKGTGEVNDFDFLKKTEVHFTGETTLDNGLTVGAHVELTADGADGTIDESYAYFSGAWGRVNFGEEEGAAYLLQVAAPSADSYVDGLRADIDGINETVLTGTALPTRLDYDHVSSAPGVHPKATRLSYLSPVVSGLQLGLTYVPDSEEDAAETSIGTDSQSGEFGETYEIAARYEGQIDVVGVTLGAGYTLAEQEVDTAANDDQEIVNVGLDLDVGPFGVGVAYKEDNYGLAENTTQEDEEVFVVGVDYTTGPFKLGASYYNVDNLLGNKDLEADRYTGGVVYSYGPGMSLRGSVSYVEYEDTDIGGTGVNEVDATSFLLGTQVKF